MNVLHIHSREGGVGRFFVALARAIHARAVEQRFVIRPGRSWGEEIAAPGPAVHTHDRFCTPPFLRRRMAALVARWQLRPVHAARLGAYSIKFDRFADAGLLAGETPDILARAGGARLRQMFGCETGVSARFDLRGPR